jgi:hypothetical protein
MNQELPVQMHPRYQEFLVFMANCPYRKTPETMQTAFWAWLNKSGNQSVIVVEQAKEITVLKADLDRLHRERDNFQQQARVLSEEIIRIENIAKEQNEEIKRLLITLGRVTKMAEVFTHLIEGDAIGERAEACLSIDGGNL